MVDNEKIKKLNKILENQLSSRFGASFMLLIVTAAVVFFGVQLHGASHAASLGTMSLSPTTATVTTGSTITVSLKTNSGTDTINAVQATVNYDATDLQYTGMTEGGAFTTIAATNTSTPGTIQIARGTPAGTTVTGTNTVVSLSFKVIGSSGTSALTIDPTKSYIVRSTDNVNTLNTTNNATYTLVLPAPGIVSVSPTSGLTSGGGTATVTGQNFVNGASINVGGAVATNVVFVSGTSLTYTIPARAAGAADVIVTNPDGQSATLTSGYTYTAAAPTISTVSPVSGSTAGGTSVTITGTNFSGASAVTFGAVNATSYTVISATSITAIAPAGTTGTVSVSVKNSTGTATKTGAFTYTSPAPSLSSLTPLIGFQTGGGRVTLTGANFRSGVGVSFGGVASSSVTVTSASSLSVIIPAHAPGKVDVVVTNSDGQSTTLIGGYSYYLSGDANNDGRVNAIDLSLLIAHDNQAYPQADFNGDGTVGAADLAILIAKWTW